MNKYRRQFVDIRRTEAGDWQRVFVVKVTYAPGRSYPRLRLRAPDGREFVLDAARDIAAIRLAGVVTAGQ